MPAVMTVDMTVGVTVVTTVDVTVGVTVVEKPLFVPHRHLFQ